MRVLRGILAGLLLLTTPVSLSSEGDRIRDAIRVLERVESGRELLGRAKEFWKVKRSDELLRVFRWGEVSRTDAVLTRHYHPETGEETREREITVFIRRDQRFEDLILDVAHELTHAIASPAWDPYDPELTAGRYIRTAIEGAGGEVEALHAECRIGLELERVYGFNLPRCRRYRAAGNGELSRELILKDFYRVGRWKAELVKSLGEEARAFAHLSADAPQLLSSTGRAPYPLALLREFQALNQVACENTRRRITLSRAGQGRSPASFSETQSQQARLLQRRCQASR
jgi:hypothetical protein